MKLNHLKAIIAILAEDRIHIHEKINLNLDDNFLRDLPKLCFGKYTRSINQDKLREGMQELIIGTKSLNGNSWVDNIIIKAIEVIFSNTTQTERQHYFEELIDYFYMILNEKLLQEEMPSPILSLAEYKNRINRFIPIVKLKLALKLYDNTQKGEKIPEGIMETTVEEIYQYILCPRLLTEDCYKILSKKLGTFDYKILEYALVSTAQRQGQLGDYFKLEIILENSEQNLPLSFFGKFFPADDNKRELSLLIYKKEEFFYGHFIPILKQLGLGSITNFAADSFLIKPNDCIILEDLSVLEYAAIDLLVPFNYETLAAVMRNLAKLHSCSLIFEEKLGKTLGRTVRIGEYYANYFKEVMYNPDVGEPVVKSSCDLVVNFYLDKYPDLIRDLTMEDFKEKVKYYFGKVFQDVKPSKTYRNVVNHGDMWGNNILIRTDSEKKCVSSLLVDYQLIRYCPPAIDILFVMHANSDKSTRDKYSSRLLDDYYSEMKHILKQHGIDVSEIYPYETLMECVHEMKSTAICMSLLYNQLWLMPKEVISDIMGDIEKSKKFFDGDRVEIFEKIFDFAPRRRIKENIEELYEICSR
nr:uncharacterized protein LOC111517413 [Leptinotarsa decemlineata]